MTDSTDIVRLKSENSAAECPTTCSANGPETEGPRQTPLGVSVPGYEILGELGRGGMGVVYKARQAKLNRLVALKVMIAGSFAGPVEKARFQIEAEAVARLQHENIVQVHDIGRHLGIEYIAFEFVDGPTIQRWQGGRAIQPFTAARIASAIARAVQHAHDRGIVHRDLKPGNILLSRATACEPSGDSDEAITIADRREPVLVPKVMDFGLAKVIEGSEKHLTQTGIACGTPNYMSPEQVRSGPNSSRPSVDVWGIGAVLFELLAGRPPFIGADAAAIMQDILLLDPPSVRKLVPQVPRDLGVIVGKCLEKDPTRRYLCAGDVAEDLDRMLARQPISARPIGPIGRIERWVKRNPLAASLGSAMIVGLVVVSSLAVALSRSVDREREASVRERSAREGEEQHRLEAEAAMHAAELARDEARANFKLAERALGQVEGERDRAEQNLAIARSAVNHVLSTISSCNEGENPALVPVYNQLLTSFEPFVAQMLGQKKGDRDLRFDRAFIARSRGLTEAAMGRFPTAREKLLVAAERFEELLEDDPSDRDSRRELSFTRACLGCVSAELGTPDAPKLLQDARQMLEAFLADYPNDRSGIESMIRIRLVMSSAPGNKYNDEHNRAVLDLVDRLKALGPITNRMQTTRAHALNNIASDLTNCGKTDEAEKYWLEVLALREELARSAGLDKIPRYELAKCLTNYAKQLAQTGRADRAFQDRQRAASLFDSLKDDAAYRTTYVQLMVDSDIILAQDYASRSMPDKAIARLTNAIALNSLLLQRDRSQSRVRGSHANAHTRRAELNEREARYESAVRDYRTAMEFSTSQPHRDYCHTRLIQSLARKGDVFEAAEVAKKLDPDSLSQPLLCLELARGWLSIARCGSPSIAVVPGSEPADKIALQNARKAIQSALNKGLSKNAQLWQMFLTDNEFEPLWDEFGRKNY